MEDIGAIYALGLREFSKVEGLKIKKTNPLVYWTEIYIFGNQVGIRILIIPV